MDSEFVIRQHTDSIIPTNDPSIAETLNKYKFPPVNPQPQPQIPHPMMGSYGAQPGYSNNEMFLGAMLGQIQANMQNQNQNQNLNGFQLNINTEVLRWLIVLLLVATLIWIIFRVSRKERSPVSRRLKRLERSYRRLKKAKRKNPKTLPDSEKKSDSLDDYDDFDDDFDDDDDFNDDDD